MKKQNIVEDKALVSIIVPVYNIENYLSKCIESIIQQTYKNLQIILINDGSTDNSGKICEEFAIKDNRIEVIHKANGGLVSARKAGLEVAKGLYIGFVDGDDYIEPVMYKKLVDNIMLTGADFVHTGFYKGTEIISQLENKQVDISRNKAFVINHYILSDKGEHIKSAIFTKLFRSDFIKSCYLDVPDSQQIGEDLICLILCILRGKKMSLLDASYYYYNVRDNSLIHNRSETALLDGVRLFQVVESILKKYNIYGDIKEALISKWLVETISESLKRVACDEFRIGYYGINNMSMLLDKKIVVYGAGRIGRDYYSQICRYSRCNVVAWIDANYQRIHYDCCEVIGKEALKILDFDVLLIAVKSQKNAQRIKDDLITEYGIKESKLLWIEPNGL